MDKNTGPTLTVVGGALLMSFAILLTKVQLSSPLTVYAAYSGTYLTVAVILHFFFDNTTWQLRDYIAITLVLLGSFLIVIGHQNHA